MNAAQIMGLRVAGVDMLESDQGPLVMEVNSSPGREGIEGATGLDIAGVIIDYIASQVAFPELDVRRRLSTSANYGVVEIVIHEGAAVLAQGMTIGDLRGADISVLTLHRGGSDIPNPNASRLHQAEDRLVCFGKLEAMRALVPARRRRMSRPAPQPLLPTTAIS